MSRLCHCYNGDNYSLVVSELTLVEMIGAEAARVLNRDYVGPSIHRRGTQVRNMFLDGHLRFQESVIMMGNMCQLYLQHLGQELSQLEREVYDEFFAKVRGEIDALSIEGQSFGSCPMLFTNENCPEVFRQIRETTLHSVLRNFMCKSSFIFIMFCHRDACCEICFLCDIYYETYV